MDDRRPADRHEFTVGDHVIMTLTAFDGGEPFRKSGVITGFNAVTGYARVLADNGTWYVHPSELVPADTTWGDTIRQAYTDADAVRERLREEAEKAREWHREAHAHRHDERRRHPSSDEFHRILKEMGDLHDLKQSDYGRTNDPFANIRASEDFGLPGWVGAIVRANDKMRRLQKAAAQVVRGEEITLANEGIEDSFLDLAVYAVIALVMFREESGLAEGAAE